MSSIFDDIERSQNGPPRSGETHFGYLNRSNRIEAERVRALVEDWVSRYPEQHRSSLVSRLRSTIDSAHISAFFELLIHELLIKTQHRIISVEPQVPNSSYQPDFLVETPSKEAFYLEVVTSMGISKKEEASENRLNEAVRVIDEVGSNFHFLNLEIKGKPERQVTLGKLRKALITWIGDLPKGEEANNVPPFVYDEHGMILSVTAFPRRTPLITPSRAIGVQVMEPYFALPGDGIRDVVKKKASRYGDLNLPYVVAVNTMNDYQKEEDAVDAMFGSPCFVDIQDKEGKVKTLRTRASNGVWLGKDGPRKQGLSAVISTELLSPWSIGQRRARLIRNPWPKYPLPQTSFAIDELNLVDKRLSKTTGQSFGEIFNLHTGWPEL